MLTDCAAWLTVTNFGIPEEKSQCCHNFLSVFFHCRWLFVLHCQTSFVKFQMWLAFNLLLLTDLPARLTLRRHDDRSAHHVFQLCQMSSVTVSHVEFDMHFRCFKFPAGRYDRSVSPRSGNGPRPFNFHFCRMRQVGQWKGDKFAKASLIH